MFPYLPISKEDEVKMLQTIGVDSIDDLFKDIPDGIRFKGELNLPKQKSEIEIRNIMKTYAKDNTSAADKLCFLGNGSYDSYIPSVVPYLTSRSEFSTAYTPYQPEISQGTLHAIFEFQTLVCRLTDMHASNASMYDGPTAAAEAALMAIDKQKGDTFYISSTVHEHVIEIIRTYLKYRGYKVELIPSTDFVMDTKALEDIDKNAVGVLVQSPNRYGYIENYEAAFKVAEENKALKIMYADPSSLAILKTPGEYGADIAVGEMQQFGNPMHYGGPHIGFIATTKKLMRKLPGRIAGQGVDRNGKRAFVLTLQAREQHIRRDKASSNICSNQALNALSSTIYMSLLGKKGLKEVAINSAHKAHYLEGKLLKLGMEKCSLSPFYREFVLNTRLDVERVNNHLEAKGVLALKVIDSTCLQIAVTENRTKAEIDYLVEVLEDLYE